jgi:hypothetical protein
MAKILPGIAVNKISGTIAGTTYQNWRGILVARSKPTPTNVNTARQSLIRSFMTSLSRAWRDVLNPGLRTAWNQRAKNYPWLDVFGNAVSMTGENLYIKQNMVLLDHSLPRRDTPVPDVMPPELDDVYITPEYPTGVGVHFPALDPAVITAQAPFINVTFAGGYLFIVNTGPEEFTFESAALPNGRKHQKSDFRHVLYADRVSDMTQSIAQQVPAGYSRNCVMSIQQFNKYGNFSAPRLFVSTGIRA